MPALALLLLLLLLVWAPPSWAAASPPLSCANGKLDGSETDVDCGGGTCAPCDLNKFCDTNEDCRTGMCETDDRFICLQDCSSRPCGSFACPRCPAGFPCEHNAQCRTELCDDGVCTFKSCPKCGEPLCPKCPSGHACQSSLQCASKLCSSLSHKCLPASCPGKCGGSCDACPLGAGPCQGDDDCQAQLRCSPFSSTCLAAHCFNAKLDAGESDVDCGGSECLPCPALAKCRANDDCAAKHVCDPDAQVCVSTTCLDGIRNFGETGVDCGNSAQSGCLPCQTLGSSCQTNDDVDVSRALWCDPRHKVVVPETCFDGMTSPGETGVDCGGPCANKCPPGQGCSSHHDCTSLDCYNGECLATTCKDGLLSPSETGVDCGGKCRPCSLGQACRGDADCQSGMCSEFTGKCQPNDCATHCGGPCDACPDSSPCSSDSDCASGHCFGEALSVPASSFGRQMGAFLYPEAARGVCLAAKCRHTCGTDDCPGCKAGRACTRHTECASGKCDVDDKRVCLADTCSDGIFNGLETDVDCGGPVCLRCGHGLACARNGDCVSTRCGEHNACLPPSCWDGVKSPLETDVDCGGPECQACLDLKACSVASDCKSGACDEGICVRPSCTNAALDKDESDLDCGGPGCRKCDDGKQCLVDGNCASGLCKEGVCMATKCREACGAGCVLCHPGQPCTSSHDCLDSLCTDGRCVALTSDCARRSELGATDLSGCGGPKCPTCNALRSCQANSDCSAGLQCSSHKCLPVYCFDGVHSGEEGCVDGGGLCLRRCDEGEACLQQSDCASGLMCQDKMCKVETIFTSKETSDASDPSAAGGAASAEQSSSPLKSAEPPAGLVDCSGIFVADSECAKEDAGYSSCSHVTMDSVCDLRWNCSAHSYDGGACKKFTGAADDVLARVASLSGASLQWPARLEAFFSGFFFHSLKGIAARAGSVQSLHAAFKDVGDLAHFGDLAKLCRAAPLANCNTHLPLVPSQRHLISDTVKITSPSAAQSIVLRGNLEVAANVEALGEIIVQSGGSLVVRSGVTLRANSGMIVLAGGSLVVHSGASLAGRILIVAGSARIEGSTDLIFPIAVVGEAALASSSQSPVVVLPGGALTLLPGKTSFSQTLDVSHASLNASHVSIKGRVSISGGVAILNDVVLQGSWESHASLVHASELVVDPGANVSLLAAASPGGPGSSSLVSDFLLNAKDARALRALAPFKEHASEAVVVRSRLLVSPGSTLTLEGNATVENLIVRGVLQASQGELTVYGSIDAAPESRLLLASTLSLLHPRTSATSTPARQLLASSSLTVHGRILFSGALTFSGLVIWTLPDFGDATSVVFDGPFIAASPTLTIGKAVKVTFNGPSFIIGRLFNHGSILIGKHGRLLVANSLSGSGSMQVDGSFLILGEAIISGALKGTGSIFVDVRDAPMLASVASKLFPPASMVSTCHTRVRLAVSPTLFATFVVTACGVLKDVNGAIESLLGVVGNTVVLTGSFGAVVKDKVPSTVQAHLGGGALKANVWTVPGLVLEPASAGGGSLECKGANIDFDGHVVVGRRGYLAITAHSHARFHREVNAHGEVWVGQRSKADFHSGLLSHGNFTVDHRSNATFYAKAVFSGHLTNSGGGRLTLAHSANMTVLGSFFNHGDLLALSASSISLYSARIVFASTSLFDARGSVYIGHHGDVVVQPGALFESTGEFVIERGGMLDLRTSDSFFDGGLEVAGDFYLRGTSAKARARCTGYLRVLGLIQVDAGSSLLVDNKAVVYGKMVVDGSLVSSARGVLEIRGALSGKGSTTIIDMSVTSDGKASFGGACELKGTVVILGELDLGGETVVTGSVLAKHESRVVLTGTLRVLGSMEVLGEWVHPGSIIEGNVTTGGHRHLLGDENQPQTLVASTGFSLPGMQCDKAGDMIVPSDAIAVWSGRGACPRSLTVVGELVIDAGASLTLERPLRGLGRITVRAGGTLQLGADSLLDCIYDGASGSVLIVAAHVRMSKSAKVQRLGKITVVKSSGILAVLGKAEFEGAVLDVQGEMRIENDALVDLSKSSRFEAGGTVKLDGQVALRSKSTANLLGRARGVGKLIVYDSGKVDADSIASVQVIVHRGGSFAVWSTSQIAVQSQGSLVFGHGAVVAVTGAHTSLAGDTLVDGNVTVQAACVLAGQIAVEGRLVLEKNTDVQGGSISVPGSLQSSLAFVADGDSSVQITGTMISLGLTRFETGARFGVSAGSVRLEDLDASGPITVSNGVLELAGRALISGLLTVNSEGLLLIANEFCRGEAAMESTGGLVVNQQARFVVAECGKAVIAGAGQFKFASVRVLGTLELAGIGTKHLFLGGDLVLDSLILVSKGALVEWSSAAMGTGALEILGVVDLFHTEMSIAAVSVEAPGTLTGSGVFRSCRVHVRGRLEPGRGSTDVGSMVFEQSPVNVTGVLEIDYVSGLFDLLDVYGSPLVLSGLLSVVVSNPTERATGAGASINFVPVTADILEWHANPEGGVVASGLASRLVARARLDADSDMRTSLAVTISSAKGKSVGAFCSYHLTGAFDTEEECRRMLGGTCTISRSRLKPSTARIDLFSQVECDLFCAVFRALRPTKVALDPVQACEGALATLPLGCVTDGRGTAPAHVPCQLPFVFDNHTYYACAQDDVMGDWCLTSDGRWGGCRCGPWISERMGCVTNGIGSEAPGVACSGPCIGRSLGGYGACVSARGLVGGCSKGCTSGGSLLERVPEVEGRDSETGGVRPECVTNGIGDAPPGELCAFPFWWGGKIRYKCVGVGMGGAGFCVTTKGQRGGCACSDLESDPIGSSSTSKAGEPSKAADDHSQPAQHELLLVKGPWAKAKSPSCSTLSGELLTRGEFTVNVVAQGKDTPFKSVRVQATPLFTVDLCGLDEGGAYTAVLPDIQVEVDLPLVFSRRLLVDPGELRLVEGGPSAALSLKFESGSGSVIVKVLPPEQGGIKLDAQEIRLQGTLKQSLTVSAIADGVEEAHEHFATIRFVTWGGDHLASARVRIVDKPGGSPLVLSPLFSPSTTGSGKQPSLPVLRVGDNLRYSVSLASKPYALVSVALTAPSGVDVLPNQLLFTSLDWSRPKQVELRLASEAWLTGAQVAVVVSHVAKSLDGAMDQTGSNLSVQVAAQSAAVLVHPAEVLAKGGVGEIFVSLAPWRLTAGGSIALRGQGLMFDPPGLDFAGTFSAAGESRRVLVRVADSSAADVQGSRLKNAVGRRQTGHVATIVDSAGGNVNVTVHMATPVLEVSALSVMVPGWFQVTLSSQPSKTVSVAWEASPGDVCLDVNGNWASPCPPGCNQCATDGLPFTVRSSTSTWTPDQWSSSINVSVVSVPNRYARDVYSAQIRLLVTTMCADGSFINLPLVFGPGLIAVPGVMVLLPPTDLGPLLMAQRTRGANVAVSLGYCPRANVSVSADACTPTTLVFPALSQVTQTMQCSGSVLLLASSADPTFDGVSVQVPPPSGSDDGGLVTRIIVGATTSLATLVAILVVWIYFGPRSFTVRFGTRRMRGKRKVREGFGGVDLTRTSTPTVAAAVGDVASAALLDSNKSPGESGAPLPRTPSPLAGAAAPLATVGGSLAPTAAAAAQREFRREMAALFIAPPPTQLHAGQSVAVYYDFDSSYHTGTIVANNGNGTYHVEFVDGDEDEIVDCDDIRLWNTRTAQQQLPRRVNRDGLIEAKVAAAADGSGGFGLKLGATSNGRVVITGFTPDGPAHRVLELALGDEVVQIGGVDVSGEDMDQVLKQVRGSGALLQLRLRPAAARDLALA